MQGCQTCSSDSSCTSCIDEKAKNEVTKCTCDYGMKEDGTCKEKKCQLDETKIGDDECQKCSALMAGCKTCTSSTVCT